MLQKSQTRTSLGAGGAKRLLCPIQDDLQFALRLFHQRLRYFRDRCELFVALPFRSPARVLEQGDQARIPRGYHTGANQAQRDPLR